MARPSRPLSREIERIPENLYRDPVDFLLADHYRQKMVCDILESLPQSPVDERAGQAAVVLHYLEHELPDHVRDEEIGLFPRLRRRCPAGEDIRTILAILSDEHQNDDSVLSELIEGLRAMATKSEPVEPARFANQAAGFVDSLRRHLSWEDATILKLARTWLTPGDLIELGREMAHRRGVAYPE